MKNLLVSAIVFLASCTLGPDYRAPSIDGVKNSWHSSKSIISSNKKIDTKWWENFNDPLLKKYIDQAKKNNKDLDIALANLKISRAQSNIAGGRFWPTINSNSRAQRAGFVNLDPGRTANIYNSTVDASWEIDIFGGNRRGVEAANARVNATKAQYQDVMLSTFSQVARVYYEARGLQKRIANTEKNTSLLKETFKVIQDRLKIGEVSDFDLSRAKSEYELTNARIPNLKAELKASIYSLSVLLGLPPEELLEEMQTVKPLPTPPDIVPVGLRSEILRRRPDIRAAERELAASIADIGNAKSDLFPKFFLTSNVGSQALKFSELFANGISLLSLASSVQWSIFEGGAIRARVKQQTAESEAALAQYEKAVLEALRDTESALIRYGQELQTRKRLEQGVKSLQKATSIAEKLYNSGEQDYLAVVDAKRQLILSEDDLIISETNSITKLITLYTTLGGGWEEEELDS